jgi:hypothetical protein
VRFFILSCGLGASFASSPASYNSKLHRI